MCTLVWLFASFHEYSFSVYTFTHALFLVLGHTDKQRFGCLLHFFFGFPIRLITRQFRLKNTCHIIPQRSTFVLQIQVFNLGFFVVRQQLFLCPFEKMSGMKLPLQGCCNRAFFMIFSSMLYSILASITNSLGLSLPSQATRLKNSYEIVSLTFVSSHFAAQTATIHKNTFRLIPAKLYLTARQYTNPLHLG